MTFSLPARPKGHAPAAAALCALALWLAAGLAQAAMSGRDVMKAVRDHSRLHDSQTALLTLDIRDKKDRSKKRWLRVKHRRAGDTTKTLLRLFAPRSLDGVGMLSESVDGAPRPNQWLYLPSFRRTRKLSSSDQNRSFLGSDLTRRDLGGRDLDTDTHRLLRETPDLWVVESVPRDEDDLYSKMVLTIDRHRLLPTEVIFFDGKGRRLKTLKNTKTTEIAGMNLATETVVTNHQTRGKTYLWRSEIDLTTAISDGEVSLQQLDPR